MSDITETKPDPAISASETKPEETTPATGEGEQSTTEAVAETATETAEKDADTSKDSTVKTSDSMFSMFGGGPKKEKKEEAEEPTDEPSGSSKAQKATDEVSFIHLMLATWAVVVGRVYDGGGVLCPFLPIVGSSQISQTMHTMPVPMIILAPRIILTMLFQCRRKSRSPPMSTSSPSFT